MILFRGDTEKGPALGLGLTVRMSGPQTFGDCQSKSSRKSSTEFAQKLCIEQKAFDDVEEVILCHEPLG